MYVKLFSFLLIVCQIVLNGSAFVQTNFNSENDIETLTITQHANLPEGYVAFPEDHAAYKVYTELVKWNVARERCISDGARLAITDSVEKIQHINSVKNFTAPKWIHVGVHRLPGSRKWVRVDDNLPITSVPWVSWESDMSDNTEDCAGISLHENGLVHYGCESWEEYFVCEIPI